MSSRAPSVPARVACYARVSTEDQAERQTIIAQTDFLRRFCDLHELPIAGVYVDDGVSGVTPLDERPAGRRLIQDAESGAFTVVLIYRLDRLGRSLKSLLAAHERLDAVGVAIRSGTEPLDTESPIGKFLFSLLGSMAELERSTIAERMTRGRDRVARQGQYVGGPVPTGYVLDDDGRYVPSNQIMPVLGITEAELVRDIFSRIAYGGSSLNGEATRLTALGVPRTYRYGGATSRPIERPAWTLNTIHAIVHNPIYRGIGTIRSRYGDVSYEVPALVDPQTWERAQEATTRNRKLSKKNAKREYHLRGLLRCGLCGSGYVGATNKLGRVYRCHAQTSKAMTRQEPCPGGILNADRLEESIWQEARSFVNDPAPYIEQAQRELRERLATVNKSEEQRKQLLVGLTGKEQERERVLSMFRRGRITTEEAERELDAIAAEASELRNLVESLQMQVQMTEAQEGYLVDVGAALAQMQNRVHQIEEENDWKAKRELIELLIPSMIVRTDITGTTPGGRRRKQTRVAVKLAFRKDIAVVSGRRIAGRSIT